MKHLYDYVSAARQSAALWLSLAVMVSSIALSLLVAFSHVA